MSDFISQELYLLWLWFSVHICKMISPAILSFFQKSYFLGFSKFINKCQKEILMCTPSSCVWFFCLTMTYFVSKYHLYSSKTGNFSYDKWWCYYQTLLFNFMVSYLYSSNLFISISEMADTSATVTYNSMRVDTPSELFIWG